MTPLVSILSASRNCREYIGQCIRSVVSQTYKNWEMIIVDDCSTDGTYERACEIARNHANIKVVQNVERLHCGANYDKILSIASGDICGVLDADDSLDLDAISTIVKCYVKYTNIDFIWTNHRWYNGAMTRFKSGISSKPKNGNIYNTEHGLKHCYSHWRTFRTYMRDRAELFDKKLKCSVDKNLGYTLEENGNGAYLDCQLYYYRYYPSNMSHHSSQKQVWRKIREKHAGKPRNKCVILPKDK